MGKKSGGDGGAAQARADEQARQERIRQGTEKINSIFDSQFNDGYYGQRQQAYMDYATPQLEQQYADAQKALSFALARSGNSDSSARAEQVGALERLYDTNKQKVADDALSYGNQARTAVEDARGNLISTLNASGDATGAANSALSRAAALSQPDAYSPLGQLFASFTNTLGTQAALERANAYAGAPAPRYQTGLFAQNPNAVTVS